MDIGTRVENQVDPRIYPVLTGTVIESTIQGLDGWVLVEWDDGRTFEEAESDVTVIGGQ